jgi:hypothetical protein
VKGDDRDRTKSDAAVEAEVQRYADSICPVRDRSPQARLEGAIRTIYDQAHGSAPDANVCIQAAREIEGVLPSFPNAREKWGPGRADGVAAWYTTAQCLGKANRCSDALAWFLKSRQMNPDNRMDWTPQRKADEEKAFPQYVPECKK